MAEPPLILIGWELGAGAGHLVRLIPLIQALRGAGWQVVAAVRDRTKARSILSTVGRRSGPGSFMLGQAPIFTHRVPGGPAMGSLSEILANIGFADPELLHPVVHAWQRLLDRFNPTVVLADAAPSLVAAVNGQVPVIGLGNGWTLPPTGEHLARLPVEWADGLQVAAAEARIVRAVEASICGRLIGGVSYLIRGDQTFVCTASALDPYRSCRKDHVYWPPELVLPDPPRFDLPAGPPLAYFPAEHSAIGQVREALCILKPVSAYFAGRTDPQSLIETGHPIDFAQNLPLAPYIVHHGGLGTACYALAAGVPQLIIADDLEKHLIGRAVVAAGCGVLLPPTSSAQQIINAASGLTGTRNRLTPMRSTNYEASITTSAIVKAIGVS